MQWDPEYQPAIACHVPVIQIIWVPVNFLQRCRKLIARNRMIQNKDWKIDKFESIPRTKYMVHFQDKYVQYINC